MKTVKSLLERNTLDFENYPLLKPSGFREYDARWWYGAYDDKISPEVNLPGIQLLGKSLGTLIHQEKILPKIVVGHDFRHYSLSIKHSLTLGLIEAGIQVYDIGLSLSPMAYFAQFHLNVPAVAMVTASHNPNGWTGVKMGIKPPLTFGPDEMKKLKDIALNQKCISREGGSYELLNGLRDLYINDLVEGVKLKNKLKVVVACGNGTAGAFAKDILSRVGAEVIELDCELDCTFPNYNPNPEDLKMLNKMSNACLANNADICFGFDGDGDRCGVVDNNGKEIFADKMGVLVARHISEIYPKMNIVVDVKSTSLFSSDPILRKNGVKTEYYKTGHSYIKKRCQDINAIAGFEKSGHYFFSGQLGRGYDCAFTSAIIILKMLDQNFHLSLSEISNTLPKTWGSPTMSPSCPDEVKYKIVESITSIIQSLNSLKQKIYGLRIVKINLINGVRFTLEDGSWCLVRASSNSPNLVVVIESPTSNEVKSNLFLFIENALKKFPEVGAFDQV